MKQLMISMENKMFQIYKIIFYFISIVLMIYVWDALIANRIDKIKDFLLIFKLRIEIVFLTICIKYLSIKIKILDFFDEF